MSMSLNLFLTNEPPLDLFESWGMKRAPEYRGRGVSFTHPSGMSVAVWEDQPYTWHPVVADLGIDYRWYFSMNPPKGHMTDQIDLIVGIGVDLIHRVGGEGIFEIDEGTILMRWSAGNVTVNADVAFLEDVTFDDSFTVTRAPLKWPSDDVDEM